MSSQYDVAIIGGSFAGLAAALQLGRARRTVTVFDTGRPRNRFAHASHGFLTHDGDSPASILETARQQLDRYETVRIVSGEASVDRVRGGFTVTAEGDSIQAARVLLTHGVADNIPKVDGLDALWGTYAFHCPYCHGYEVRDQPLAVLNDTEGGRHAALLLRDWSHDVILLTNGSSALKAADRAVLKERGVVINDMPISRIHSRDGKMDGIEFVNGQRLDRYAIMVATRVTPNGSIHSKLGCATKETPMGTLIDVNERFETSVPNVFAAGDLTRMAHSVSLAVGDGALAGATVHQSLLEL